MSKRGISAVVTTLIIILITIVAIGIVWVVVKNVIESGKEQIEISQRCSKVHLNIKSLVVETRDADGIWNDYNLTISREGSGENSAGIKFVLSDGTTYSNVTDFGYKLTPLSTKTNSSLNNLSVVNATQIEITPYFLDSSNKEILCSNTITKEFN